jgi:acetyl esterase/lipase
MPAALVALSPWVDMQRSAALVTTHPEADLLVSQHGLKMLADSVLSGSDPGNPLASPIYGNLSGLPVLYIQVGSDEILVDDAIKLTDKARQDGLAVRLDIFPEMQHVFQFSAGNMPEADDAVARIGAFLREHLDVPPT